MTDTDSFDPRQWGEVPVGTTYAEIVDSINSALSAARDMPGKVGMDVVLHDALVTIRQRHEARVSALTDADRLAEEYVEAFKTMLHPPEVGQVLIAVHEKSARQGEAMESAAQILRTYPDEIDRALAELGYLEDES